MPVPFIFLGIPPARGRALYIESLLRVGIGVTERRSTTTTIVSDDDGQIRVHTALGDVRTICTKAVSPSAETKRRSFQPSPSIWLMVSTFGSFSSGCLSMVRFDLLSGRLTILLPRLV